MKENRFITFLSLVETRSYTKTANDLFISQPGVTHHIKSLESEYGVNLFDNVNKKLVLTKAGEEMVVFARTQIKLVEDFTKRLEKIDDKRELKIKCNDIYASYLLNDNVYQKEYNNSNMCLKISNEITDFDIFISDNVLDDNCEIYKTIFIPYVLIINGKHELRNKKKVSIDLLSKYNIGILSNDNSKKYLYQNLDTCLCYSEFNNINMLKSLANTSSIAFLPRYLVEDDLANGIYKEVIIKELNLKRKIYIGYSKNHPNIYNIINILNNILKNETL